MLEQSARFEVCAEAENGAEAVEQVKVIKPDVVVLNVTMPVLNGFEAAKKIDAPGTAIVILSTHADKHFVAEARKMGVRAYLHKSKIGEALIDALEAAVNGEDFVLME